MNKNKQWSEEMSDAGWRQRITARIASVKVRQDKAWSMVEMYRESGEPHGVMDAGSELEALQRARVELEALL